MVVTPLHCRSHYRRNPWRETFAESPPADKTPPRDSPGDYKRYGKHDHRPGAEYGRSMRETWDFSRGPYTEAAVKVVAQLVNTVK